VRRLAPLFLLLPLACGAAPEGEATEGSEDAVSFLGVRAQVDRSMPDVDSIGYDVDLRVTDATPGREAFEATALGTFVATRDLDALSLDLDGNDVAEVRVGATQRSLRAATFTRKGASLEIALGTPRKAGRSFVVQVRYAGRFRQADGANPNDFASFGGLMVRQRNAEGRRIFGSLDWPSKARRWLPLRDHPRDGAMFALRATFPKELTVVANGSLAGVTANSDGTKTWRYEAAYAMPTYDFHVSAYDGWKTWKDQAASGVDAVALTYGKDAAQAPAVYGDLVDALDFYERTWGSYRFGKSATFLEEPIFGGGMEHASVVSMDETLFSGTGGRHTAFHELAHHWSGNLVRIGDWNDFWLSEGTTEYLTARFEAAHDGVEAGRAVLRDYRDRALQHERYEPHALRPAGKDEDVLAIFDPISYQKGAMVWRMLERRLGTKELDAFLRGWFARHAFGAVTTDDLERELGEQTGTDLHVFFEEFVRDYGRPELTVTMTTSGSNVTITVAQTQRIGGPVRGFHFPLDVDLVKGTQRHRVTVDVSSVTTTKTVAAPFAPERMDVDPDVYLYALVR
jgi:aminopeptidase N